MKNKTVTVTDAVINSQVATIYNATIVLSSTGRYDLPSSPRRIYFTNNSGEDIEFNVLRKNERSEYNADPTTFVGISILNGGYFNSTEIYGPDFLRDIYYLVVTGAGGGAGASIIIYLIDYV